MAVFKSLMSINSNTGPRAEPYGTPTEIGKCLELYPLMETYCFLSFK